MIPRTHQQLDEAVHRMEQELASEKLRWNGVAKRQDDLENDVHGEGSRFQESARAEEAISNFDAIGAQHLKAAEKVLTLAVQRANDPQNLAMEQARLREVARDRTEGRKFIVQLVALFVTAVTTVSGSYFVSRSGSHEGAHQAIAEHGGGEHATPTNAPRLPTP